MKLCIVQPFSNPIHRIRNEVLEFTKDVGNKKLLDLISVCLFVLFIELKFPLNKYLSAFCHLCIAHQTS